MLAVSCHVFLVASPVAPHLVSVDLPIMNRLALVASWLSAPVGRGSHSPGLKKSLAAVGADFNLDLVAVVIFPAVMSDGDTTQPFQPTAGDEIAKLIALFACHRLLGPMIQIAFMLAAGGASAGPTTTSCAVTDSVRPLGA